MPDKGDEKFTSNGTHVIYDGKRWQVVCLLCNKKPSYGETGALYCGKHKSPEHKNFRSAICEYPDCKKIASFGQDGKRRFCKKHKGINDIRSFNKCIYPDCTKTASFGIDKARWCYEHKQPEDMYVYMNICEVNDCPDRAYYGTIKVSRCIKHRQQGDIKIGVRLCIKDKCTNIAQFGTYTYVHCKEHRNENERDLRSKQCIIASCTNLAYYGIPNTRCAIRCHIHKLKSDIHMKHPTCSKCNRIITYPNVTGNLCVYCDPEYKVSAKYSQPAIDWLNYVSKKYNIYIQHMKNEGEYKIGKYFVDGYCKDTNTVYEFYGDYFHGNPNMYAPDFYNKKCKKTMGELYTHTLEREQYILSCGYLLITIWQQDWEILKKTGSNLMNMINGMNNVVPQNVDNNRPKRRMKGPTINLDEMPDITDVKQQTEEPHNTT